MFCISAITSRGFGGDNYSFLWNLWWMRKALSAPDLEFFHSTYLFSPFGVDLINHPQTALQGYISATALAGLTVIEAENLYIIVSVFLNAACAYALALDHRAEAQCGACRRHRVRRVAVHRRALARALRSADGLGHPVVCAVSPAIAGTGGVAAAIGCGSCVAIAAYARTTTWCISRCSPSIYTLASWRVVHLHREPRANTQPLFTVRLVIMGLMALDLLLIS